MIAAFRKKELQKLADLLSHLPPLISTRANVQAAAETAQIAGRGICEQDLNTFNQMGSLDMDLQPFDTSVWPEDVTAEQLMFLADSLNVDGMEWMTASLEDSSVQSQIL